MRVMCCITGPQMAGDLELQVDVEENPYLAKAESVSFVPTFKIYKNGFKVKEIVGPTHQALENVVSHFSL